MQRIISNKSKIFGIPFTVIKHVKMAKGKAKIVCSIFIVSAKSHNATKPFVDENVR